MHTIGDLFDAAKAARGIGSDYRLAKELGLTTAAVSVVRRRNGGISDAVALQIAEMAGLPADYVLACACAHRAIDRPAEFRVWEQIAKKAAGAVACLLISVGLLPNDIHAQGMRAEARPATVLFIHYAQQIGRALAGWLNAARFRIGIMADSAGA